MKYSAFALFFIFVGRLTADTFEFSYTFNTYDLSRKQIVHGAFQGTQNGDFVQDVSDFTVYFGDALMPGTVQVNGFNLADKTWNDQPVISFVADLNRWEFGNFSPDSPDRGPEYWYANMGIFVAPGTWAAWATANVDLVKALRIDMPGEWSEHMLKPTWTLGRVATVPEAGYSALLLLTGLLGLGIEGAVRRAPKKSRY